MFCVHFRNEMSGKSQRCREQALTPAGGYQPEKVLLITPSTQGHMRCYRDTSDANLHETSHFFKTAKTGF